MTEVLSQPTSTIEEYERDRLEIIERALAGAAIDFNVSLAESKPAPFDDGSQHLPEDVFND